MYDLIKKLNECLLQTQATHEQLISDKSTCEDERRTNKSVKNELNLRRQDVERLEKKYHPFTVLEATDKDVRDRRDALNIQIARHKEHVKADNGECNRKMAEAKDQMKIAKDWQEELRKEQKLLDEEKITYKEDIQKTIDKQLQERGIKL